MSKCNDISELQSQIDKNKISVNVEHNLKKTSLLEYSIAYDKFVIHPDSGITNKDILKVAENTKYGNGITRTTINKKLCTIIVCHKGAILNKKNTDQIAYMIGQINLRSESK